MSGAPGSPGAPPSGGLSWVLGIDLAFVDGRLGDKTVDRFIEYGRDYADNPLMDDAGRLCAALATTPPVALRLRVRDGQIEMGCACSRGRPHLCEHVSRVLVDLAVHPRLREILAVRGDTSAVVGELPGLRAEVLEERTLDDRLERWLPSGVVESDLEIDVEVVRTAGLAAKDERPALELRHRRPGSRMLLRPRDVVDARLPPRHRRLIELTAASHADKSVLVSTRGQASMLLHLLREEPAVFTRSWKSRLRFREAAVAPRIEPAHGRLVARWYDDSGRFVADAERTLLFTGAFPYLWSESHDVFHPVAPEVDLDVAWGLTRVPSLPLSSRSATKIGRTLLTRGRGVGVVLPPPEVFGLPPMEAPSFELALTGSPLDVRAELHAIYRAARFVVTGDVRDVRDVRDASGRDDDAEARALALVREAGIDADGAATEDSAVHLWHVGLPALRASTSPAIVIVVAEALARVKIGPPVNVHVVVGAASGWLDTELHFTAAALSVELTRLRAALAGGGRWVALSDGTLAKIGDEVTALVRESASLVDEHGRGRLAPNQLGRIERWIDTFACEADDHVATMRSRLRALAVRADAELPAQLDATLRPYQLRGVAWLQFLRELGAGGVLADDMGLGKTLMTLVFLAQWKEASGDAPSIVVCPTSVVGNWVNEVKRFVPQLRVLVHHGVSRAARGASLARIGATDLVVTTYAVLRRDADVLSRVRFRCAILDEAQNVKNASAATSRAAQRLVAQMRIALSGTPVENRLGELWSIMSFVNPGMLGTPAEFGERFEQPIANEPRGDVAEQLRALVRPFVLRRTKREVLPDLPAKTEIERACVLGLRQKRLYDALALTLRGAVKEDVKKRGLARSRMSVLTAILRLRQMACDPRLVEPSKPSHSSQASDRPTDSAKRVVFMELVRELVAEGRRALVFSQFVELLTLWREDLDREKIAYEYLDGSSAQRDAIVERFQKGDAPLFLISLKAGGAGLNLTAADTVIHCDPWWNPAVEEQATDRAHRMGQEKPVTVVRLIALGTIEEKIALLKGKKRELAAAVLGSPDSHPHGRDAGDGEAENGLTDADVDLLLGALPAVDRSTTERGAADVNAIDARVVDAKVDEPLARRFVLPREVDELRAILRLIESSGTPRKDLAKKVGLPVARVALLLIGHAVPIPTRAAEKIRALRLG